MKSIASFCRQHGFPQRRVLRHVRKELLAHVEDDGDEWDVDRTNELGVAAHREAGAARITYRVTDRETLWHWLAGEIGASLLDREQWESIAEAARLFHQVGTGQHDDYAMHFRDTGEAFTGKAAYFEQLDRALQLMGA